MHTLVKPAELRLHNGTEQVVIRPRRVGGRDPVICRTWDLGSPDVRYTSTPNPGADGVTETGGFLGSRTVTLELQIMGGLDPVTREEHDAYWYVSRLIRMTHPAANPILSVSRYDDLSAGKDEPWQMVLRGNPYSVVFGSRAAAVIELQLTFTCPGGQLESTLRSFATRDVPEDDDLATDWIFPAVFPKGFGLMGATYPILSIPVGGDSAVTPIVYISGPVKDPEIRGDEGEVFAFDGLTLAGGETVQIDMGTGDIRLGRVDSGVIYDDMSAYGAVDWGVSTYWTWAPGVHRLSYLSTTGTVTVQFRERRFTI